MTVCEKTLFITDFFSLIALKMLTSEKSRRKLHTKINVGWVRELSANTSICLFKK